MQPHEYLREPYIAWKQSLWATYLPLIVWVYVLSLHDDVPTTVTLRERISVQEQLMLMADASMKPMHVTMDWPDGIAMWATFSVYPASSMPFNHHVNVVFEPTSSISYVHSKATVSGRLSMTSLLFGHHVPFSATSVMFGHTARHANDEHIT